MEETKVQELITTLRDRFEKHPHRHPQVTWEVVQSKLEAQPEKHDALHAMEESGGEPDVVAYDESTQTVMFCDCSTESPAGRRSLCYDREALESRKKHKPRGNAMEMAKNMGTILLSEAEYRSLQALEPFDLKTSSWVRTPESVRGRGGALFCDRRYDQVFVYHNGADSYYAARGFRVSLSL